MWENDSGRVPRVYKKPPHPLAEKDFAKNPIAEMGENRESPKWVKKG